MESRREWRLQLVVRGTDAEVDAIAMRVGEVVCVPPDHDGPCETPWMLIRTIVDDLDEPERSSMKTLLDDE